MESLRFGSRTFGTHQPDEVIRPTLAVERSLLAAGARYVGGIDEVGRGALAGPVSVGVCVVDASADEVPEGLADSKLLTAHAREALMPVVSTWGVARAVGHASAEEIDAVGIIAALRRAAVRALESLAVVPDVVILDGSHDWLTRPDDIFADQSAFATPPVHMMVKADQQCASVAAASVLAKVTRDAIMQDLETTHPGYGLASHKGYASEAHRDAIRSLGASTIHRRSWNLLGD